MTRYAQYAWIVDVDHVTEPDDHQRFATSDGAEGLCARVGWTGPGSPPAAPALIARLQAGEGRRWRLYSDYLAEADNLDYEGRILTIDPDGGGEEDFGPLDDLGRPDCGFTAIKYVDAASGEWRAL